jgi:hypothetical protein
MQTKSHTEIENASADDIGKIALMNLGGGTLAIESTLSDCLSTAAGCGMTTLDDDAPGGQRPITAADVDDRTDLRYLASGDLVAVEITE